MVSYSFIFISMSLQKSTDTANTADASEKPFVFSWRRFILHASILVIGLFLGWLTWYFSKPQSVRFYETKVDEYLSVSVTPEIEIALDAGSSIAITDNQPMLIELFKGNVYFNVNKKKKKKFRVKIGEAMVEDVGTRFSIRMNKNDGKVVSVAEGQIKIHVATGTFMISALEQAHFDNFKLSGHRLISESEVAPWIALKQAVSE